MQPHNTNHQPPRVIELPNKLLLGAVCRELENGCTVTLRAKGNSMRPFIESSRDLVKLQCIAPKDIRKGDVVLAETTEGNMVLHRVDRIDGENITLRGDGNIRGTEQTTRHMVHGKAIAFYRKGRSTADSTDSAKWRVYSALWTTLLPVRRYLLAFYRIIWLRIFPVKLDISSEQNISHSL